MITIEEELQVNKLLEKHNRRLEKQKRGRINCPDRKSKKYDHSTAFRETLNMNKKA